MHQGELKSPLSPRESAVFAAAIRNQSAEQIALALSLTVPEVVAALASPAVRRLLKVHDEYEARAARARAQDALLEQAHTAPTAADRRRAAEAVLFSFTRRKRAAGATAREFERSSAARARSASKGTTPTRKRGWPNYTRAMVHALFIGNSFTARNDVPGLIAAMAESKGHTLSSRLISRGGASLKMHFNKGDAVAAIESGQFDTVVLQEQSTLPVKNAARFHESVRLFDAAIRAAKGPKGKPIRMVLYLTWARRHLPQHQAVLTDAYTSIGRELGATVAPAGVAWEKVLKDHPEITLHDKDDSHPTLAGSYLAACVLFATLFGESPAGAAAPEGLSPSEAKLLQKAAWATVKK